MYDKPFVKIFAPCCGIYCSYFILPLIRDVYRKLRTK